MKHYLLVLAALFLTATSTQAQERVSVHDPSIVDAGDGNYYIFGSHQAWAKTTDLYNWSKVAVNWVDKTTEEAFSTQQVTTVNIGGTEKTFKNFDAKAWAATWATNKNGDVEWGTINGNLWAPDVIYNKAMKKWCMYLSINGARWNSAIILLTADNIEGPYTYQAPIVVSGFNSSQSTLDYKLTDLELAIGEQESLPNRYSSAGFWPHAIDPCVFYDEDDNLWMSYGSWLGGIWILQLDEETGLRDYNINYGVNGDGTANKEKDYYYGKKLAGGNAVSGEASYIKHIGDYYYLFVTYGGLVANGGYQMRVFRSLNPDGPYADSQDQSPIFRSSMTNFGSSCTDNRGENIFGAYGEWGNVAVGANSERSQGHNSVFVKDGQSFLVYHTRFQNRGEEHEVRVHQLFLNEDGWLCAAPFEYKSETVTDDDIAGGKLFDDDDIAGNYKLLIHRFGLDHANKELVTPINIILSADGTITGDATGSWQTQSSNSYITLNINDTEYKGVVVNQTIDGSSDEVTTFSAVATSGVTVWGHKVPEVIKSMGSNDAGWGTPGSYRDFILAPNKTLTFNFTVASTKGTDAFQGFFVNIPEKLMVQPNGGFNIEGTWWAFDEAVKYDRSFESLDEAKSFLPGSSVELTIKRIHKQVLYFADITTASNERKYIRVITKEIFDEDSDILISLGADNAVLTNITSEITDESIQGTLIGKEDNSVNFRDGAKKEFTLGANETLSMNFINYSSRIGWGDNWIIEIQNGDKYLDITSDYFGWDTVNGDYYERTEDNTKNKYFTLESSTGLYFDNFPRALHKADVVATVTRTGNKIEIKAVQTCTSDEVKTETYTLTHDDFATGDITVRLMAAYSHLDLLSDKTITGIEAINAQPSTLGAQPMYDLSGRRVDAGYKGVVIQNGKKFILR